MIPVKHHHRAMLRFLLSLLIRLRQSFGCIALALRARFASLCRSILAFVGRRGQSQIRLHASDVPVANNNSTPERLQNSGRVDVEEESAGTLAALPVRRPARWHDELPIYLALTSSDELKFDPHPTTPERGSQRYNRRPPISQDSDTPWSIPAGQRTLLAALPQPPGGWKRCVHPEGNVLFYHEGLRIFTESDIFAREKEILLCAAALIQQAIHTDGAIMDELTEIVLNVDDFGRWHYYFVDHKHRLLFWVHPVTPREDLDSHLQGITGYSHISMFDVPLLSFTDVRWIQDIWLRPGTGMLLLEVFKFIVCDVELRSHCEYYPHNRTLPKDVFEELRGMLNYAKTDMMTADSSTSPFAQDELVAILDQVNSLKDDGEIADPCSIWVIARLMAFFTENQFLNFCGQQYARLNADTPLFEQRTWNRGIGFKLANVFLFWSLNEHAIRLQRIWVDGIIIQPRWKSFVTRFTSELARYTIFSTVMLAVNFSFLAVPGVVVVPSTSSIQIIIYCSVVLTISSIIFSFALLNVYSDPRIMGAFPAAEVMKILSQKSWGMVRFAITHSLPYACLIWSIILFSVALVVQIFLPKQLSTVVTLGVECLILVLFGFMGVRVMRLFSMDDDVDAMDAPAENESQHDVERTWAKCRRTLCAC